MNVQMRVHVLRTFRNSFTRSHASEAENRTRNRSKNCKCKRALRNTNVDKCGYFSYSTGWPGSPSFMFSGKEKIMMQKCQYLQ